MDIENESSSSSSSCQLSSFKQCNINSKSSAEAPPQPPTSHKRKAGRKKFRETRHPLYKGVRQRNGNKWVCEVREPNKKSRIWLGTFPTPEMAGRAHDIAALAFKGDFASLNFPDSASILPRAKSSSARDIQVAALEAAEAFRPTSSSSSSSYSQMNYSCETSSNKVLKPSLSHLQRVENENMVLKPKTLFLDEEALFNMPGLLDSMAEGLILTPLGMKRGYDWDDTACATDLTLWRD